MPISALKNYDIVFGWRHFILKKKKIMVINILLIINSKILLKSNFYNYTYNQAVYVRMENKSCLLILIPVSFLSFSKKAIKDTSLKSQ